MVFFYWLIAIMPLDQHPFWGREFFGTFTIIKALGVVCFLIALARIATRGVYPDFLKTAQARWYLLLLCWQCSSYFVHWGQLALGAMAYSHVISIATLFIAAVTLVDSRKRLRWTLLVAIGSAGFASLYTVRQQQKYGYLIGFRPGGLLGDANEYALVVGLWMPIAFIWALSNRPIRERLFCFGSLGLMALGVTFAASRGGFIGVILGFLFLIWNSRNRVRNLVLVAALAVPLALFSGSSVLQRFTNPAYGDKLAEQARVITWKAGLRMIAAHPLVGVGLHNFKPTVTRYENGEGIESLAHNTYIEVTAELGIPGGILFVGTLLAPFWTLERNRRRALAAGRTHPANVALGLEAGLLSFAVSAFFVSGWWEKMLWLMIFLTTRLHLVLGRRSRIPRRRNGGASLADARVQQASVAPYRES